jgi:hypothetical protein
VAYLSATDWLTELVPPLPTVTGSSTPLTVGEVGTVIARSAARSTRPPRRLATQSRSPPPPPATSRSKRSPSTAPAGKYLERSFPNQGGPGGNVGLASEYRDAYMSALAALRKGEMPILGAALDTSGQGRELPRSYSTSNPSATAGVVPLIDLDYDF